MIRLDRDRFRGALAIENYAGRGLDVCRSLTARGSETAIAVLFMINSSQGGQSMLLVAPIHVPASSSRALMSYKFAPHTIP